MLGSFNQGGYYYIGYINEELAIDNLEPKMDRFHIGFLYSGLRKEKLVYEGYFNQTRYNHNGILREDSSVYSGGFSNGFKHGLGVIDSPEFKYVGDFKQDKIEGFGYFKEGQQGDKWSEYVGMWKEG